MFFDGRIGAVKKFLQIRKPILVEIPGSVAVQGPKVLHLPGIQHAVTIAVID